MRFERTDVWGFDHAIRGMRNPLESWKKSDSFLCDDHTSWETCKTCRFKKPDCGCSELHLKNDFYVIGENDIELMKKLISAGSEHRKFLRQIMVSVDISAPIYWFKEFDTYRIGVTENSTSTMHKLTSKPITRNCFECGDLIPDEIINHLENLRKGIFEPSAEVEEKKALWKALIVCLPESWIQTRTVTMNYENILNMVHQRQNHKLSEWSVDFIEWVKSLPYADDLIFGGEK
ncbi:MAG: hypothetical protein MJ181_11495 [Treponema sp.]|nr:hypothetical protein [Treponema sp.]